MIRLIIQNTRRLDSKIFLNIFNLNGRKVLDRVMKIISTSADGYYYLLIFTAIWVLNPAVGAPLLMIAILSFTIEIPIQHLVKILVKRDRPFEVLGDVEFVLPPPDRFSFPSGHTAGAFVLAIIISTFFPVMTIPLFLWAGAVGISRIYIGVHYPSDVLAGVLLGILSVAAAFALVPIL